MFDNSFYPHINMPTRIAGSSATCIDHIWSNVYHADVISGILTEMISDHMITFQCTDIELSSLTKSETSQTFTKIDFNKLPSLLNNIRTDDILSCEDLDHAYRLLEGRITDSINSSTINVHKKKSTDKPWFDKEVNKFRNKRQRLYKKFIKTRKREDELKYREINKAYEKLIIQKKKAFNHGRLDKYKSSLRQKWGVINDILGRSKNKDCRNIRSIDIGGVNTTDDGEIANSFNDFLPMYPMNTMINFPRSQKRKESINVLVI